MTDPLGFGNCIPAGKIMGCITIDITDDADGQGYLFHAKRLAAPVHANTAEAVTNLLSCLHTLKQPAFLIGHGSRGQISTGCGLNMRICTQDALLSTGNCDSFIGYCNTDRWKVPMSKLAGKISHLYLLGCYTGDGQQGLLFLNKLASIVKAPVAAPTGYITCLRGNFQLMDGSSWEVAFPEDTNK